MGAIGSAFGSATAGAAVALAGVRKQYGAVAALNGVDLTIAPGEVVAILGPNGAGKTTAINLMLGLRRPTAGQVHLGGLPPTDRRARSRCGAMLQDSGVPPLLTVRELVDLFRTYYSAPLSTDEAIAAAGLEEPARARAQVRHLSGGQRQRLYFALAICGDPAVLFLDEPTAGMDVAARRAFLDRIREFARAGKTIVLTTHYLEEADALAERIVVLSRGVVIADAPPAAIKARVAAKRVTFRCPGGAEASAFAGLPISQLDVTGDQVALLSTEAEAVLRALFTRGLQLTDLEVAGADLEEAFLALTGRSGAVGDAAVTTAASLGAPSPMLGEGR
jgi:ABC-2 type transport system ATP-binding protein